MNEQRRSYLIECLNAAANLYGVISFPEFMKLYNRYAANHEKPVSDLLMAEEIKEILAMPPPDELDLDSPEIWFGHAEVDGTRYIVAKYGFYTDPYDDDAVVDEKAVCEQIEGFEVPDIKILPERDFLLYDEPKAFEETGVTKRFVKFLRQFEGMDKLEAEFAVWDVQEELRYAPSVKIGLLSLRNTLEIEIDSEDELEDLVDAVIPLVRNTRAWDYRGHTETELVEAGVFKDFRPIAEDARNLYLHDLYGEDEADDEDDDSEDDAFDDAEESDEAEIMAELEANLPPAAYPTGPVDFRFVKDKARREQVLAEYQNARQITQNFVRYVLMKEMTEDERKAAAKRLGFDLEQASLLERPTLDCVAGDFGSMMDDQNGEPPIKRVLAKEDTLHKIDRLAVAYYKNYRYAWLVVEAAKAGVGLKCRNLMNGEELFLMEMTLSQNPDIKGMTICAGIAPMGQVYMCLGTIHPAAFEPSEAVHKMVRQKLGLPLEGPLDLSFADQARFAEETIRRIHAIGRFAGVHY